MFLQQMICHISNIKLIKYFLLDWIPYHCFAMCLNEILSWYYFINVLNGSLVENFHIALDGVSSTLFFIEAIYHQILECKPIQTLISFYKNEVLEKLNFCLIKGLFVIMKIIMLTQTISDIYIWWITFCISEI